jgi:hypothetical protein
MIAPVTTAATATGGEVGCHNPVSNRKSGHGTPDSYDLTDKLVADNGSWLDACKIAGNHVQIGTAYPG